MNGSTTFKPCKPLSLGSLHQPAHIPLLVAQPLHSTWMARLRLWEVPSCPWISNMSLPLPLPALLHINGRFLASHLCLHPIYPSSRTPAFLKRATRVTIPLANRYADQGASRVEDKAVTFLKMTSSIPTLQIQRLIQHRFSQVQHQALSPICRPRQIPTLWRVQWCIEVAIGLLHIVSARSTIRQP